MKAKQYREMTSTELDNKMGQLKEELFNLRFQMATGQLENPMQLKSCKHDIARIKTIIREREMTAAAEQA